MKQTKDKVSNFIDIPVTKNIHLQNTINKVSGIIDYLRNK